MADLGLAWVVAALGDDQMWIALGAVATFAASLVWWILKELKSQQVEQIQLAHEKIKSQHELSVELKNLCITIADTNKLTHEKLDNLTLKVEENTTKMAGLAEKMENKLPLKTAG